MGRKRTPGLINRAGIWHIDKQINGRRIRQSTGSARLEEAERFLARLIEEIRQAVIYGVRPQRTFETAAQRMEPQEWRRRKAPLRERSTTV